MSTMSAIKFEASPLPSLTQPNSDGLRKRRKKAPAQGAADDCFTCSNRNLTCDRRRPYCSQCLDGGQDCAGYKTQLTWGVGVASRGKLRGLSLPVAGTTKIAVDSPAKSSKPRKRAADDDEGSNVAARSNRPSLPKSISPPNVRQGTSTFTVAGPHLPLLNTTIPPESYLQRSSTTPTTYTPSSVIDGQARDSTPSLGRYSAACGRSPVSAAFDQSASLSPPYNKTSLFPLSPYPTPSPTNQYLTWCHPQPQLPLTPTSQTYQVLPDSSLHLHAPYYQTHHIPGTAQQEHAHQATYAPGPTVPDTIPTSATRDHVEDEVEEINRDCGQDATVSDSLSTSPLTRDSAMVFPLAGNSIVGKTPRIQYLIQYYAEVISPVIVAFDSPTNPLRNQILSLALRSESLQHAISALSASNIRQRRESGALSTGKTPGARRSSYMHLNLTTETWDTSQALNLQDQKREESLHKNAAIQMLNRQLANPVLRKDDSVLATLLMLCLFHICDSGIARFQAQFAGVKKLLTLRGDNLDGSNSNTKWMTRIFTLFDSVAATVNDREGHIGGQYVDICSQADGEWSYETLSGIDSHLCKIMARLGRLNVLGQGQPVELNSHIVSRPLSIIPNLISCQTNDFGGFDGNGWMRILSDEDFFNLKTASPTIHEQFWREWHEIRQDLLTWSFDATRFNGSDPSQPYLTPEQCYDINSISESFRYSSLLYTERLADSNLPSTDPKIQDWVQKSLYHIKQVRADVYLLWPLFITGAECGEEQERNVIRERCLDIQKDSGFMNNSSCLTLLEKVWRGDSASDRQPGEPARQPSTFRFRDIMLAEGNEGEWIVV